MLETRKLTVYYGKVLAINEVDLEVGEGEVVAVLGPNGAGKTTLVSAISGLLLERKRIWRTLEEELAVLGSVYFMGEDVSMLPAAERVRRGIVHCPERRRVFPEMTVEDNLLAGAHTIKDSREVEEALREVYRLFPVLAERRRQLAGLLSGGEQQMLAIGRALMSRPKLIMLDEPMLGLAPAVRRRILDSIREIRERGVSVLLAEQSAHLALEVADRGYVLESGVISLEGSREELKRNPHIREAYLGVV